MIFFRCETRLFDRRAPRPAGPPNCRAWVSRPPRAGKLSSHVVVRFVRGCARLLLGYLHESNSGVFSRFALFWYSIISVPFFLVLLVIFSIYNYIRKNVSFMKKECRNVAQKYRKILTTYRCYLLRWTWLDNLFIVKLLKQISIYF